MIPFSYVTPVVAVFTVSVLVGHSTIHASRESIGRSVMVQGTGGTIVGCAATRAASVAIPFERVDLGPAGLPQGGDGLLLGPRILTVVTDSTRWAAVWRVAVEPSAWTGESIPVPPVAFGRGVLVLVATDTYGIGPVQLRVTSIRQCRRSRVIVVTSTQTGPGVVGTSTRSRGLDVVQTHVRELVNYDVIFEHRFRSQR